MEDLVTVGTLYAIAGIALLAYIFCKRNKAQQTPPVQTPPRIEYEEPQPNPNEPAIDYSQCYQRRYLLTKNEWHEYKKLKQLVETRQWLVCPKVRLLDLIEPRNGVKNYKTLFYKIQAKHVDFVICDQNLYIKAIIELDDNSHNQAGRQERDRFVDAILTSVGYKVIRTRAITEKTLEILDTPKTGETGAGGPWQTRSER